MKPIRHSRAQLTGNKTAVEKLASLKEQFLEKINEPVSAIIYEFHLQAKDEAVLKLRAPVTTQNGKPFLKDYILLAIQKGEVQTPGRRSRCRCVISIFEGLGLQWFIQQKDKKNI